MTARRPAARKPATGRQDRAAVERARKDVTRAAETLEAKVVALERAADRIGSAALEAERESLAAELAGDRILRDVLELHDAFAAAPPGTLPAGLEVLRKLPDALLDWASRRLGLQPHLRRGEELEVPADRLAAYDLDRPAAAAGLVRLRIVAPGWKRAGRVLVKPQAVPV
jgi:hypothetical protein